MKASMDSGCESRRQVLDPEQARRIHDSSLAVLEKTGILIQHEAARDLLLDAGAAGNSGSNLVRIPAVMVERALATVPARILLRGGTGAHDLPLGPDSPPRGRPVISLDWILDAGAKRRRPVMADDLEAWVRVADALPNLVLTSGLYPWDVPVESKDIRAAEAMIRLSGKPLMIAPFSAASVRWIGEMLSVLPRRAGPRLMVFCSCNSPLIFSESQLGVMLAAIDRGLPVMVNSSAVTGVTAPVTLAGTLALMNAEMLAGIVVAQLRRPGASLVYAGHPIVLDLRTSIAACGYTEAGLLQAALVDLGRSYGIPTASNGLTTDSHLCDSQAAVEKWNIGFLGVLAGAVLNGGAGSLGSLSTASLEQMVIDDDIYGRMTRICDGVTIDTDTLALDVIAAAGPNGHFLEDPHTLRHMRREFRHSALAVRLNHENWIQAGATSAADAAHARVQSILAQPIQPSLEPAGVAELQKIADAAERALAAA